MLVQASVARAFLDIGANDLDGLIDGSAAYSAVATLMPILEPTLDTAVPSESEVSGMYWSKSMQHRSPQLGVHKIILAACKRCPSQPCPWQ